MLCPRWFDSNQVKAKFGECLGETMKISMRNMSGECNLPFFLVMVWRDPVSIVHRVGLVLDLMF